MYTVYWLMLFVSAEFTVHNKDKTHTVEREREQLHQIAEKKYLRVSHTVQKYAISIRVRVIVTS